MAVFFAAPASPLPFNLLEAGVARGLAFFTAGLVGSFALAVLAGADSDDFFTATVFLTVTDFLAGCRVLGGTTDFFVTVALPAD